MEPFTHYLNNLINKNRSSFSEHFHIRWLTSYAAESAREKREALYNTFNDQWLFKETKPFYRQLSKGCSLCGQGTWSCLFITNRCNASCFYCPAAQKNDEIPATQSLTFESAERYADYIKQLGFQGVSFSGGEPMLYFDRTLHFLKTIRKRCSPDLYIWLYTNGILATAEKFKQLADAGINEVRFDIGATGYRLNKAKPAQGIIPNITVEIPAVPEEKHRLKKLLPVMIDSGITNLNLHQLRLTRHNATQLLKRRYTFIPAEQPIVLESELAALEILGYAKEKNLPIGINYCSFFFKNRFQPAGFRKILAKTINVPDASVTEKGFLREFTENSLIYKRSLLSDNPMPETENMEIPLFGSSCYIRSEIAMEEIKLDATTRKRVEELIGYEPPDIPKDPLLFRVWQMEFIEKGLRDY